MRIGNLIKRESTIDIRLNPAFGYAAHDLLSPAANLLAFAPHVAEVQAEDSFVAIHQCQRIEARHLRDGFERPQFSSNAGSRSDRHSKHPHPSSRAQRAITFLPTVSTERIDYQFNAFALREIN